MLREAYYQAAEKTSIVLLRDMASTWIGRSALTLFVNLGVPSISHVIKHDFGKLAVRESKHDFYIHRLASKGFK
jgi:hypothetical protein